MSKSKSYKVITGAVHVHTLDSDGTKSHEEIAVIAQQAGIDFLLFADHMTLQSLHEEKEGYYGKVLVLIGYEHNDREDCNHYLLFDIDEVLPSSMTAEEYVVAAAAKGALGIMAHPDEIRGRDARFRSYPWTAWDVNQFDGMEIWNQMSEWMEHLKSFNVIRMIVSPRKSLRSPTSRILRKWDELSQRRRILGVGAADAHGFIYRAGLLRLTIFPYKVQFRTLRTHLLLEESLSSDLVIARRQVYEAMRQCRVFVSNYRWGDASQFRFEIDSGSDTATIGEEIGLTEKTVIRVGSPLAGKIRLIGNGRPVAEFHGKEWSCPITEPGIYRVEIYRGQKGWIFSNHIRVHLAS